MDGLSLARELRVFLRSYGALPAPAEGEPAAGRVPPATDGKTIPLQGINDYTGMILKEERAELDTSGKMETMRVCSSSHGGLLDNPGLVTAACGNVLDKWDQVWQEKEGELANTYKETGTEGALYGDLVPCFRPKPPGEEGCFDNQAFYDTIEESADKLWLHTNEVASKALKKGESKHMMAILGSVALTRNKLWVYNEQMTLEEKPKPFAKTYAKWVELTDGMAQQVLEYQTNLVATVVLTDPQGQDWTSSKPYRDGEAVSQGVQFWWYHMQGLRMDLSNYLPPKVGQRMLGTVLNDSLSVLAVRYSTALPSLKRVPQYRADILAILLATFELVLSCLDSLHELLHPIPAHRVARAVHAKCEILTWNLVMVGCPLKTLHRVCLAAQPKAGSLAPLERPREESLLAWLHVVLPGIFGPSPAQLSPSAALYLSAKMAATVAGPAWPHLVRAVLAHGMALPTAVMSHFGAFVPGVKGEQPAFLMTEGCGNLHCLKTCFNSADLSWPATVGSGLLYIVMHGNPDKASLRQVMEPLLRKLGPQGWECVDSKLAWSSQRPVWFQAIVDLLEQFFVPILEEILEDIDSGKFSVQENVRKIPGQFLDVSACIPPSFFQVCEMIEGMVPDVVHPLCDSVVAHVMITAIYGMITKIQEPLQAHGLAADKGHQLRALGENLIQMKSSVEMQKLEGLTDASANTKTEEKHKLDSSNQEVGQQVSEVVAAELLAEPHGQVALKAVHRFLAYNAEWAGNQLGVSLVPEGVTLDPGSTAVMPWGFLLYRNSPSHDMLARVGALPWDQLLAFPLDWEAGLRCTQAAPGPVQQMLLSRRAELTETMEAEEAERSLVAEIRELCTTKPGAAKQVAVS